MLPVFFLFLGLYGADAGTHSFKAFYTATTGVTNYPEFTTAGVVDGVLINSYDSFSKQVIPRTDWMKNSEGPDYWKRQTDIIVGTEQSFKNNIQVAMERFNHTGGVHTFQFMYGCEWEDETETIDGFHQYGYDGEDLISLDFKELKYISPVQQGLITTQKWNNDKSLHDYDKQYYSTICIDWLKKYVQYGKSSLDKTVSPKVSLLQKDSSSPVTCHATGFYPGGVTITWMKNGQDHHEDVELGELLPNEDGTFQKTSKLKVKPDEWGKNQFSCVVQHQGKSVTVDEIWKSPGDSVPVGIIVGAAVAILLLVVAAVVGFKVYQKKKGFKPVNTSDGGSNSSNGQTGA